LIKLGVELLRFKEKMVDPVVGLQCTPKKGKLKDYPNTFKGEEAIEWALLHGSPAIVERTQAMQMLQRAMEDRRFVSVDIQEDIFHETSLYTFVASSSGNVKPSGVYKALSADQLNK
jgi:hypothetical protein